MMHPTAVAPGRGPARRGFVLLIAISVLAILAILVFGLAAGQDLARGRAAQDNSRRVAYELGQVALDGLTATGPRAGDAATTATAIAVDAKAAKSADFREMPEGKFLVDSRPARAGESCYTAPLLTHRDGDRLVALCVSVPLGPKYLRLTQTYLVTSTGEKPRRVLLTESLATEVEAELTATDEDALRGKL
jgi:hypothetical protein